MTSLTFSNCIWGNPRNAFPFQWSFCHCSLYFFSSAFGSVETRLEPYCRSRCIKVHEIFLASVENLQFHSFCSFSLPLNLVFLVSFIFLLFLRSIYMFSLLLKCFEFLDILLKVVFSSGTRNYIHQYSVHLLYCFSQIHYISSWNKNKWIFQNAHVECKELILDIKE